MIDYIGYRCDACNEVFKDSDDIVVCPDCGTPHHRHCWKETNKCTHEGLHESGMSWQAETQKEMEKTTLNCTKCGHSLNNEAMFCEKCGNPTPKAFEQLRAQPNTRSYSYNNPYSNMYGNNTNNPTHKNNIDDIELALFDPLVHMNMEEQFEDDVTLGDVCEFVNTNKSYYIPKFKFMKDKNIKIFPNIVAMFFPQYYFSYRKMPGIAFLVMLLKCICSIPDTIVYVQENSEYIYSMFSYYMPGYSISFSNLLNVNTSTSSFQMLSFICSAISVLLVPILGLLANYMYMRHVVKKTSEIKKFAAKHNVPATDILRTEGGTSWGILILFVIISIMINYGIYVALMFLI